MGHEARRNSRMDAPDTPVGYKGYAGDTCAGCGWQQSGDQRDINVPHVVWSELFQQQLCMVCFRKSMTVYTRMAAVKRDSTPDVLPDCPNDGGNPDDCKVCYGYGGRCSEFKRTHPHW